MTVLLPSMTKQQRTMWVSAESHVQMLVLVLFDTKRNKAERNFSIRNSTVMTIYHQTIFALWCFIYTKPVCAWVCCTVQAWQVTVQAQSSTEHCDNILASPSGEQLVLSYVPSLPCRKYFAAHWQPLPTWPFIDGLTPHQFLCWGNWSPLLELRILRDTVD